METKTMEISDFLKAQKFNYNKYYVVRAHFSY